MAVNINVLVELKVQTREGHTLLADQLRTWQVSPFIGLIVDVELINTDLPIEQVKVESRPFGPVTCTLERAYTEDSMAELLEYVDVLGWKNVQIVPNGEHQLYTAESFTKRYLQQEARS